MKNVLEAVVGKVTVEITGPIEAPQEFFNTRTGLFVWNDFKEKIVSKAEKVPMPFSATLNLFKLTENATDKAIENSLPEKHLFTESEVCAIITDLISKQPKGERGALLSDGNWNLFYTSSCVVGVGWGRFHGRWGVGAWERGDGRWGAGRRVFSPATDN